MNQASLRVNNSHQTEILKVYLFVFAYILFPETVCMQMQIN